MNQFLQNNLITIVIFLLLIIFLLMGSMIFILFKLLTKKENNSSSVSIQEKPVKKYILKKHDTIVERYSCIHHPDKNTVGSCLICEEVFCEHCLVEHESMHFCKEHFRIFANYQWKQITDIKTTPNTPDDGLFIYQFKKDQWINKGIPSFVMTHYKINIENDFIESFIQLNVREEDAEKLKEELLKYKAQD